MRNVSPAADAPPDTMRPNRPSIREALSKRAPEASTPTATAQIEETSLPPVASEQEILSLLERPSPTGETLRAAYQQLEHELGTLLAALSLTDAHQLHKRLVNPRDNDVLATKFRRLVSDRRDRLITFLADAPRRAALAGRCRR